MNQPTQITTKHDEDDFYVEHEGPCKCGGKFTAENYIPAGTTQRDHRLTHTLPACPQFMDFSGGDYLLWNATRGLPN